MRQSLCITDVLVKEIPMYLLLSICLWTTTLASCDDQHLTKRYNGSSFAASDIYGLGIRVGLYCQAIGMFLAAIPGPKRASIGIKLTSSGYMIAILTSWTVLVQRQEMSPCEGWLILTLTGMLAIPAAVTCYDFDSIIGETFAFDLVFLSFLWTTSSALWFWATLYQSLPLLGTNDLVWFFVNVNITGWFRIFALVLNSLEALLIGPSAIVAILCWSFIAFIAYLAGQDDLKFLEVETPDESDWQRNSRAYWLNWKKGAKEAASSAWIFSSFNYIFSIVAAEMIIRANDLSPQTDLLQPGQLIPLTIGAVTLVDGIFTVIRWRRVQKEMANNAHERANPDVAWSPYGGV